MKRKDKIAIFLIVLATLATGLFLSPLASSHPDGLERIAEDYGFIEKAKNIVSIDFPIPDYEFPGVESSFWKTSLSGFAGIIIMFVIFGIIYFAVNIAHKDRDGINTDNILK